MRKGRRTAPLPSNEPLNAVTGAARLRKFMLKLFDREDGKAADWPLIAETLLAETFHALDQSPDDPRVAVLLRQASAAMYDRLSGNAPEDAPLQRGQPAADAFNGRSRRPGHDEGPKA